MKAQMRRRALIRLERLQETYCAVAACWSQDGTDSYRNLERALRKLADPDSMRAKKFPKMTARQRRENLNPNG